MHAREMERRRKAIAAIHAAKRVLDLDDPSYRDLLERVSATKGKPHRSAKDLSQSQLSAVLKEFRRLGALKLSPKTKGKPANFDQLPEMITKVEALLADMKLPWSYADAIAMRQSRIQRVAWCRKEDQLRAIIAALHVEQEKRELLAGIERTCQRVGMTLIELEFRFGLNKVKGWQRNRKALKVVGETLASEFPQAETGRA